MTTALPRQRLIGRLTCPSPGPMLVAIGGIHGNEPAGALALARVVEELSQSPRPLVKGDVVALAGNLAALRAGKRFIHEDLNRRFDRRPPDEAISEDRERTELLRALDESFAAARGPVVLLDLHTISGRGAPFGLFADTMVSRNFARRFPVPLVLGLEEQLHGTLVDFVGMQGHVAVGFEGGQHDDPESIDHLAAIVWLALEELGLVDVDSGQKRRGLEASTNGAPKLLEVIYRHDVQPDDAFRMFPGFRSFQKVSRDQVIAEDARGGVTAHEDGYLLMPLYQKQGNDGFFVVRKVWAFWLWLSAVLRYARAGRIAHWLPGIDRIEGEPHRVLVYRRVARWYSLEFLHLLGFRRLEETDDELLMERRAHDLP